MELKLNADRFTGKEYVNLYHNYRPEPPDQLLLQCLNYLEQPNANLVLALGCGTGLSSRIWSNYCNQIIGFDPSEDMLSIAKEKTTDENISFVLGYSNDINIESGSADIVTCSQSFHWMEPQSTLKEVNRILKDNGVLLIYDVIWPPGVNYQFEQAYHDLFKSVTEITNSLDKPVAYKWPKDQHLENVNESGYFDFTREAYFHKTEPFEKGKFLGIVLSQGGLEALKKRGFSEDEIGVSKFRETIASLPLPGNDMMSYYYRSVIGKKKNS